MFHARQPSYSLTIELLTLFTFDSLTAAWTEASSCRSSKIWKQEVPSIRLDHGNFPGGLKASLGRPGKFQMRETSPQEDRAYSLDIH